MAEAVMRDLVAKAGLSDKIGVDSAGVGNWHVGEPAHRGTQTMLRRHDIPHDGRARQLTRDDMTAFDYVLPVDRLTYDDLSDFGTMPAPNVHLFLKWAAEAKQVTLDEVPDPYYDGTYERAYTLISAGCRALLEHIRAEHDL